MKTMERNGESVDEMERERESNRKSEKERQWRERERNVRMMITIVDEMENDLRVAREKLSRVEREDSDREREGGIRNC